MTNAERSTHTILIATDPWGRRISMSRDTWELHVLRRHAELAPHRDAIMHAIEHPDYVYFDAIYSNRESFYAFGIVPNYERHYLKVSIEFTTTPRTHEADGQVVTTYICSNRKPKETLKWLRAT